MKNKRGIAAQIKENMSYLNKGQWTTEKNERKHLLKLLILFPDWQMPQIMLKNEDNW